MKKAICNTVSIDCPFKIIKQSLLVGSVLSLFSGATFAAEGTWICGNTNDWDNPACWSVGAPVANDYLYVSDFVGNTPTVVNYTANMGTSPLYDGLSIYTLGSGSATLNINGGQLNTSRTTLGIAYPGANDSGHIIQTNGIASLGRLTVGLSGDQTSTYTLTNGDLISTEQIVGHWSSGAIYQNGGTNTVSGDVTLGFTEQYNSGFVGKGLYQQTSGTNTISGQLRLGNGEYTEGEYNLSGGTLSADSIYVGRTGAERGVFTQSGGQVDVASQLSIGSNFYKTNNASYLLTNGDLNVSGNENISSYDDSVAGVSQSHFTQQGGDHTVAGTLTVNTYGVYNLQGGNLTTGITNVTTYTDPSSGFKQTGGVHTANWDLRLGDQYSSGIYELSDGSLHVVRNEYIGYTKCCANESNEKKGNMVQTGGTHVVDGEIVIGKDYAGSAANNGLHMSGGTLAAAGGITNNQLLSYSGGSITADINNNNLLDLSGEGARTVVGSLTNAGTIQMHDGTSVLIDGSLALGSESIMNYEIDSLFLGTETDWFSVTNDADFAGTLNISLMGSLMFSSGDSFDLIVAENFTGTFDDILLTGLGSGLNWNVNYLTDANELDIVQLKISAVPVPAAVWLFGSGLIGLIGFARHKKA